MSDSRVILRDPKPSDLGDMIRWFTEETEWMAWDAPWEKETYDKDTIRKRHETRLQRISGLDEDTFRTRYEIETVEGIHIGWVISYPVSGTCDGAPLPEGTRAVGIDIPSLTHRNKGYGQHALRLYLDHMAIHGHDTVCLETWSGNAHMVRVAEKIGFTLCFRDVGSRLVNGKRYDGLRYVKRIGHHDQTSF
jgi:RimJ/RimL family protein N-acetyltransferase